MHDEGVMARQQQHNRLQMHTQQCCFVEATRRGYKLMTGVWVPGMHPSAASWLGEDSEPLSDGPAPLRIQSC